MELVSGQTLSPDAQVLKFAVGVAPSCLQFIKLPPNRRPISGYDRFVTSLSLQKRRR